MKYIQIHTIHTCIFRYIHDMHMQVHWCTPYPISGSISGTISGVPISGHKVTRYRGQYRVPISGVPISGYNSHRYRSQYRTRYRVTSCAPRPQLAQCSWPMILAVTCGFSMWQSVYPGPSRMREPLRELEPWRACPTGSTSRPFHTVRFQGTRAYQRLCSVQSVCSVGSSIIALL